MVDYWLWIAYEPKINSCLLIQLFRERTIFGCYQFSLARNGYGNKPIIYTDSAFLYNDACKWLRLKHIVYGIELNGAFSHLSKYKEAIEYCFDEALRVKPTYNEAAKAKELAHELQIQKEISLTVDQGLQYIKNNDYQEAIDAFDKAITLNPKNHVPHNYKGDVLFKLEDYNGAIECYNKAIEIKPDYYYAWYNKGKVLNKKCEDISSDKSKEFEECYNESIECYNKAININPTKAESWYRKGQAINVLGKFEEAIRSYDEALKIRSNYQDALKDKGLALSNLGKYQAAVECFDRVLNLAPKNVEICYYKGLALQKLGNDNDAIESFEEVLKIKPDYAAAFYSKGLSFSNLSNYEQAIKCYDKAIEIDPKYVNAWNNRDLALKKLRLLNTKMMTVTIYTAGIDAYEAQEWVNELTNINSDMETEDVNVSGNNVSFKVGFSGMDDIDPRDIATRIEEYLRTNEAFKATNISISDGIQEYNFSQINKDDRHNTVVFENTREELFRVQVGEELLKVEDIEVDFALACAMDDSPSHFTHYGPTILIVQSKERAKSNTHDFQYIEPFIEALISNILIYMVLTKLENAETAGGLSDVEIIVERDKTKYQVTLNNMLFATDMSGLVTP